MIEDHFQQVSQCTDAVMIELTLLVDCLEHLLYVGRCRVTQPQIGKPGLHLPPARFEPIRGRRAHLLANEGEKCLFRKVYKRLDDGRFLRRPVDGRKDSLGFVAGIGFTRKILDQPDAC